MRTRHISLSWVCKSEWFLFASSFSFLFTFLSLQVDYLFADLHELASYIFDVMKNHLLVFNLKKSEGVKRLEMHLV